ncbi:hypothetical protein [Ancylobacter terrae]|uniref:hypothetical protein n=1 Tax=Ancylobacter sp. sgz301288 TaxID=3342077 RepID=UPI00385F4A46
MSGQVECEAHGQQDETFVCCHIANSLATGQPVGFHWSDTSSALRPDAWCAACEHHRLSAGGEWTEDVLSEVRVTLLCGRCYDEARDVWRRAVEGGPD